MLANRPRGISINKNAINVQANTVQPLTSAANAAAAADANQANLKRSIQQEHQLSLKRLTSKTPSPPKLKSQFINNLKQSENDVPTLIDLAPNVDQKQLDLKPQKHTTTLQSLKQPKHHEPPTRLQPLLPTTQAVISRIPRLREVEEEIEDIDKSTSANNHDAIFQVYDVAKDIYSYMYELEEAQSLKENFLKEQKIFTPKVRQRLVNWCVDLTTKLGLLPETKYMTISIMDRYFETVIVKHQSHVQLVGLGAMLVASKYEEIYPPDLNDLIAYAENAYSRRDIMRVEIDILEKLNFDLGKPIPPAFLRRFSRAAHCDLKMHSIAKFLMEISLSEYECAHWKPSLLAAAALFTTVHLVHNQNKMQSMQENTATATNLRAMARISSANGLAGSISSFGLQTRRLVSAPPAVQERWNKTLVHYSRYTRRDLQGPAAILCKILKKVLKAPQAQSASRSHMHNLPKWPELKSTRVDELIRLGESIK